MREAPITRELVKIRELAFGRNNILDNDNSTKPRQRLDDVSERLLGNGKSTITRSVVSSRVAMLYCSGSRQHFRSRRFAVNVSR